MRITATNFRHAGRRAILGSLSLVIAGSMVAPTPGTLGEALSPSGVESAHAATTLYMTFSDPEGGTGTSTGSVSVDQWTYYTLEPARSRPGYIFKGWSGWGGLYSAGQSIEVYESDGSRSFTAVWDKDPSWTGGSGSGSGYSGGGSSEVTTPVMYTWTISFDSAGGSPVGSQTVYSMGGSEKINLPGAPTRSGYVFQGWSNGGAPYAAGSSVTVKGNTTFTAQWASDGKKEAYDAAMAALAANPTQENLAAAENAYGQLSDEQKRAAGGHAEAISRAREAMEAQEKARRDAEAASAVTAQARDLAGNPAPTQDDITALEDAYARLTEDQKKLVVGYEEALASARDKIAARAVQDVNALVEALAANENPTEDDVRAVQEAYDALSDSQKEGVSGYDEAIASARDKIAARGGGAAGSGGNGNSGGTGGAGGTSGGRKGGSGASPARASAGSGAGAVRADGSSSRVVPVSGAKTPARAENAQGSSAEQDKKTGAVKGTVSKVKKRSPRGSRTYIIRKNVVGYSKGAFKGSGYTRVIVKSKRLTRRSMKGAFKGSKIKTARIAVSKKRSVNKRWAKKYKRVFSKKCCGKKVKIKAA